MNLDLINFDLIVALLVSITMFIAQIIYINGVVKRQITPSVFSWFCWSMLMVVTLIAQIIEIGWDWSQSGILVSTIGCMSIGMVALLFANYSYEKSDVTYLLLGLGCFGVYLISSDPWITTLLAVISDFIIGIPTIVKAVKTATSARSPACIISFFCWTLTLILSLTHDFSLYYISFIFISI